MKRPWEFLAAGYVLGELMIAAGVPWGAAVLVLSALLFAAFFLTERPGTGRIPQKRRQLRTAGILLAVSMAAGATRYCMVMRPGKQEAALDRCIAEAWAAPEGSDGEEMAPEGSDGGEKAPEGALEEVQTEIECRVDEILPHATLLKLRSGCLQITRERKPGDPVPAVGNRIRVIGELSRFPSATNPGEFDQASYYRSRGQTHRLYAEYLEITDGHVSRTGQALYMIRSRCTALFREVCPTEDAAFLSAALFGDRSTMPEELYELYRRNGIAHLLAVSGLHMAILGLSLYRGLRRIGAGFRGSGLAAGGFLIFYGALTGAGSSVTRAVLMMLLLFLSEDLGRTYDLRSAVCIAAVVILGAQPLELFQCGFQLSVLAVLSIGGPAASLYSLAEERIPQFKKRPAMLRHLLSSLCASVCVFLFTLPVTAYWFFSVPVCSIVLNLLVIPLMNYVLWAGIAALLLAAAAGALYALPAELPGRILFFWAETAAGSAHRILQFYRLLLNITERIPFHRILVGRPGLKQILLYYLLLGAAAAVFYYIGRRSGAASPVRRRKAAEGARLQALEWILPAALLTAAFLALRPVRPAEPVIWFLNIGQGDAIAVEWGRSCVLIDGGSSTNRKNGQYILRPFLESRGICRVDTAFITHADMDHTNGVEYLLREDPDLEIREVVMNAAAETDEEYDDLREAAGNRPVRYMASGEQLGLFTCLWPEREHPPEDINEQSLVLLFEYGGFRCLFTGDAGVQSEEEILARGGLPEVTLLKVGHHGSAGSTGEAFLNALQPRAAVLSYGKGNRYGHPHAETIRRLQACGCRIFRTAEEGALYVECKKCFPYFKGNAIIGEVRAFRPEKTENQAAER